MKRALAALLIAGCSEVPNPLYCDEDTDCKNGTVCNLDTHGCELSSSPVDAGDDALTDAAIDSVDDALPFDAAIVVNEVAANEDPDWVEIYNRGTIGVELSLYCITDQPGSVSTLCYQLPSMVLLPGAYYVQDIGSGTTRFGLGSDEQVWIYRRSDLSVIDGVDWPAGASPTGMTFARVPDGTGSFVTRGPTRGTTNGS